MSTVRTRPHGRHRNLDRFACGFNKACRAALLVWAIVLLAACQSDGRPVFDKTVPPDKRIPLLDGGPHAGTADTGSTVVAYEYERQPSPTKEVVVHFKGRIVDVRFSTTTVNIYLLALDGQGQAIDRHMVYASGYRRSSYFRQSWRFDRHVILPPETAAIAFSDYTRASRGRK